jgi:hypothetical protein
MGLRPAQDFVVAFGEGLQGISERIEYDTRPAAEGQSCASPVDAFGVCTPFAATSSCWYNKVEEH